MGGGGNSGGIGVLGGPSGSFNTGGNAAPGGFNQAQQNYINATGKLPGAFGGTALNQGQQNFFADKGYLSGGVQGKFGGDPLGKAFYHPQQQQMQPQGGFYGGGNDYMTALQHMFGGWS